jgi:hypothetical protein
MDQPTSSQRPSKKRRTGKRSFHIVEGDPITADGTISQTITHQTAKGPIDEVVTRSVWLKDEWHAQTPAEEPESDENGKPHVEHINLVNDPFNDPFNESFMESEPHPSQSRRTQQDYLLEFVSRVQSMLKATLSREALPKDVSCPQCGTGKIARWRCKDCTLPQLLCRRCMRETHAHSPLHHIEVWTGVFSCRGMELMRLMF